MLPRQIQPRRNTGAVPTMRVGVLALKFFATIHASDGFVVPSSSRMGRCRNSFSYQRRKALSSDYLENDLLAIATAKGKDKENTKPRLCVVRPDGTVLPLCQREDDVETDLFVDPREYSNTNIWEQVTDDQVTGTYGEGWYGQRPVPSLGGGPGYGAQADEIWSIDEALIEQIREDGVDLPVLDMGIAHGEKARAGAF